MKSVLSNRSAACAVAWALVALAMTARGPGAVAAFAPAPSGSGSKAKAKAGGGNNRDADAPLASTAALSPEAGPAGGWPTIRPRAAAARRRGRRNGNGAAKRPASKEVRASGRSRSLKPLEELSIGSHVSGRVVAVRDYGAFVDIGHATRGRRPGVALLHASQLSGTVGNDDDVRKRVRVGDVVEGARVIRLNLDKGEVGLSLRTSSSRPRRRKQGGPKRTRMELWEIASGTRLEGRVARVVPYGAFVDVGARVNALLHVSRITGGEVENVRHHLNEGDAVSVRVLDVDERRRTMAVSMLDEELDRYLDRRMSQRLGRYFGTAARGLPGEDKASSSNLEFFDRAVRVLEDILRER